jgi:hypothetical protein
MASQFCVFDRAELDTRNSDLWPPMYWAVLAEKFFNDSLISFTTECLPNLHQMFTEPIELRFSDMPSKTNI